MSMLPPALAVDMTARNVQDELKAKRLPWTIAKGLDTFTPIRYAHLHNDGGVGRRRHTNPIRMRGERRTCKLFGTSYYQCQGCLRGSWGTLSERVGERVRW